MGTIETPAVDKILQTFTLKTQDGFVLNDKVVQGQKEIAECILQRKSPDGKNKVHVMAHTRYGKSIIVGAAIAIRASVKKERWAIVAPTKEQAQIIMDYVIFFSVNDPVISPLLKTDAKTLQNERLTQRRARDHITYLNGGEVRTFSAKQTMGFGAPNLVLDEAGLTDDSDEAKAFRMLGDNPQDFFVMKIGNPFKNNHFKQAYIDDTYYHINIDAKRGIAEGRLTNAILDEQKTKPHYDVLYNNLFPDEDSRDKYGYLPLFTHKLINAVQVDEASIAPIGARLVGGDPNDEGANEGVIVSRYANLARIDQALMGSDPITMAAELGKITDAEMYYVDKQGVGSGTVRTMEAAKETKRKTVPVNAGEKLTDKDRLEFDTSPQAFKRYANQRAYIFWAIKIWLESGQGKLIRNERWAKQLLAIKYKDDENGKLQIIPKALLRNEYYNVHDLGAADALSFTFSPKKPRVFVMPQGGTNKGVEPYYPDIGV